MRNFYLISIFALLCFQFSNAQYKYAKNWEKVEKLELEGKLTSANRIVQRIYKHADKEQNTEQIVKSFIYSAKFSLQITEDAEVTILHNLQKEIAKQSFPTNAILENIYARFLHQYFRQHQYKIRKRSSIASEEIPADFRLWNTKTFVQNIHKHFQHSIENEKSLLLLPVEDYMAFLDGKANTKKFRSTLYDILVFNMLDFYKRNIPYSYSNEDSYTYSASDFAPSAVFIKQKIKKTNSDKFSTAHVLRLFQKLEIIYKDNKEANLDIVLQRLKFAHNKSYEDNLYTKALQELAKHYKNDPLEALIQYKLADRYVSASSYSWTDASLEYDKIRIEALAITKAMIAKYPTSEGGLQCKLLRKKIEQQSIQFKTESYSVPNKPLLARVEIRNIDTLFLHAYRVPHSFLKNVNYHKRDSIVRSFAKGRKPTLENKYITKIPKDYYKHSIEISIPKLSMGNYLVLLSDAKFQVSSYDIIQKTNLSETITELADVKMHTISHRETGKPIYNATIQVFDKKKIINQKIKTNVLGNASIKKRESNRDIKKYISYENDTLYTKRTSLGYNTINDDGEIESWEAKPFIFTDRSIYRPGQTVYFKGILLQQKNGVSSVVPNVYCEVTVESEDDEIKTFRLKTNEFGSFSGSCKLPKNVMTGEFTIYVDEDSDYEEDEHPFWGFLEDFEEAEYRFQVEEYKRPRFEVTIDQLTKNIRFNDAVNVTGNAKALLGSTITNAKVNYTVTRNTNIIYDKSRLYRDHPKTKIVAEGTTKTDAKGNFSIPFVAELDAKIPIEDLNSYRYEVAIEVIDLNGETQTAEQTITVNKKGFSLFVINPAKNDVKEPLKITINAEDVNNVPVNVNGRLKIIKLKNVERVLRKRPWSFPDIQNIPKETFIKQFPHEAYDATEKKSLEEEELEVFNVDFNTEKESKLIVDPSTWKSGRYKIETYALDEKTKDTIRNTQTVLFTNIEDTYLPDNSLFEYSILNSNYKNDGYVKLKLSTALRDDDLNVHLHLFHKGKLITTKLETIDKGSKIVKIPVDHSYTERITIRMSYTKFNSFDEQEFSFSLYEKNKFLDVETSTFRNKLQPGQKETWRFKILDLEKKGSNAEVLASMYDESLDQFKRHSWDVNFNSFYRNSYSIPQIETTNFDITNSHKFYTKNDRVYFPNLRKYLKFNWFGLDFGNLRSTNHQYLFKLKKEKKRKNKPVSTGNITGYVFDESGLPLPAATVLIKGTETGVTTDFDGLYTINASSNDTLVISYIGFNSEEINIGTKDNINITLQPGDNLEEVVVMAYAISEKQTAGISITVNGKSIQSAPVGRLDQMLQGKTSGLNINIASGQPGANGVIKIRGVSSYNPSKQALFIVDGVPVDESAFKSLNQNNITSLSILKDASATALYGTRGANGVIIIDTKYGTRKETIDGMQVIVGLTEDDINTIETRKDLRETAFFYPHLRTDSEGSVLVEFEAPEALTRWKFQLFAHQKNGMYGNIEKNAVTQKELMVVPNMPRFLREKDTIVITTKVVNLQNTATKGIASLRLFNAYTMESMDAEIHQGEKNKAFTIDAKGNTNVSWKLYIPEGVNAIQYKVIATAGNFSDGEESALPVLKNSILITEAKPIWVKAGAQKEVTFSKLANNTSTSLKQHKLTLEYTSNPTWSAIQSLPYLLEYPYECAEQTFSRLYANALATHILQRSPKLKEVFESWKANGQLISDLEKNSELKSLLISETPWARDAVSETEQKKRLAQLFDSTFLKDQQLEMWLKLEDLQAQSGGFPWFAGGKENVYITLHILQTFGHLMKLNVISDKKSQVANIMKRAYKFVDDRFLIAHSNLSKTKNTNAYKQQLRFLYTRSMIPNFMEIPKEVKRIMDFYVADLQRNWILLSIGEKAMLALTLERMGKHRDAKKIMEALEESAVKTAETGMYWKEITEARYYNSHAVEKQALLIEAFSEIVKDDKIVQELQLWLLQQKQTSQWATTKATTKAIYALVLNPKEFVSIKDNTVFTVGTEKIKTKKLNETEKEAGSGYFKTSWNTDEVTMDKATISIKNNGKTAGYGGVYWQYFEELDQIKQNDETLVHVTKALFVKENKNDEEILVPIAKRSLKIGDLITVRLIIKNKKDIEFIHLKDMRAAGLEPVSVLSEYKWQDGIGYFESTRDASSNFFFDKIPEGVFILEYEVRVNNTGAFSNGITTIESMYAPAFRSHTKGIRIKVE